MPFYVPQAGATPAVFFTPVNFQTTGAPIGMLADAIDFATGELLSIERGFDPTDAAVMTALRTVRDSGSAVEDVGQRYADAKLITPQLRSFFAEETRLALEHLTSTNQISLDSVEVVTEGDSAEVQIGYTNLARNAQRLVALPLNQLLGRAVG